MDILNDSNWDERDWDNMNVETVEAMATDALEQVEKLLADPDFDFNGDVGKRLVYRLENDLGWACQKYKRGLLHRNLLRAANKIEQRAAKDK